jgi:hypothetical protein
MGKKSVSLVVEEGQGGAEFFAEFEKGFAIDRVGSGCGLRRGAEAAVLDSMGALGEGVRIGFVRLEEAGVGEGEGAGGVGDRDVAVCVAEDVFVRGEADGLRRGCVAAEMFAGTDDGEAFVVEQALDFVDGLDVFAAIEAVAAGALDGLQHRKFGLPVAEDECLGVGDAAHFANTEESFFFHGVPFRSWGCAGHQL